MTTPERSLGPNPVVGGVLAIVRLRSREPAEQIADALARGGVHQLEVTLPTPGAERAVERWRRRPGLVVGAGTVRTARDVRRAVDAGAQFLVTPTVCEAVLEAAAAAGVPVICGAATPTEIESAWRRGAAAVKVFPARPLGGPSYVRAVREPLDDIPLVPTGGIADDAVADYRRAGCVGVGVGGGLVAEELVARADWDALTGRAAAFARSWAAGADA